MQDVSNSQRLPTILQWAPTDVAGILWRENRPNIFRCVSGCSLEPSQRRGIFSGSLHEVEKSLRRIVSPAACELPVPAPPCLWSCPSSHHSSRADTSATAISSLIGGPRWAEMCRTGQGATDTAATAEGPVGAMPETLCVFHPFSCQ